MRMLLSLFILAGVLSAQTDRFEVASIRATGNVAAKPSMEFTPGGGVRATNVTLKMLIQMAYDIRSEQVSGGPSWTDSELYTVIANGPAGGIAMPVAAEQELAHKRLQALLGERFHVEFKREPTPASGYVLIEDKKGHKMTRADDAAPVKMRQLGRWELDAQGVAMRMFAQFLSAHLHGTVEDRTGLEGRYTFHLKWAPGEPVPGAVESAARELPEESLLPAVQEQLGLKLERQKVATDRFTILRAERPTEN